jgi:hypothetical protein
VEAALATAGMTPPENARVMHISDTLHLAELLVSEAYREELETSSTLELLGDPQPMQFDDAGNLLDVA